MDVIYRRRSVHKKHHSSCFFKWMWTNARGDDLWVHVRRGWKDNAEEAVTRGGPTMSLYVLPDWTWPLKCHNQMSSWMTRKEQYSLEKMITLAMSLWHGDVLGLDVKLKGAYFPRQSRDIVTACTQQWMPAVTHAEQVSICCCCSISHFRFSSHSMFLSSNSPSVEWRHFTSTLTMLKDTCSHKQYLLTSDPSSQLCAL